MAFGFEHRVDSHEPGRMVFSFKIHLQHQRLVPNLLESSFALSLPLSALALRVTLWRTALRGTGAAAFAIVSGLF